MKANKKVAKVNEKTLGRGRVGILSPDNWVQLPHSRISNFSDFLVCSQKIGARSIPETSPN